MFDQTQRNKSRDVDTLWRHREKQTLDTPPAESRVGGLVWTSERNSRQFCILSLVKSESPKIMERSVSLLPSAGGCKFHFVSALLSCDLVFAVHLPARQETRDFRNYQAATCPASNEENYIRTGAGEEEGDDGLPETTLVCQYSLLEDFSISVRRNFWWIVLSRHNFLLSWGNSIQISPEECLSRFMRDIQGEKFKAQNFSTSETPNMVLGQTRWRRWKVTLGF